MPVGSTLHPKVTPPITTPLWRATTTWLQAEQGPGWYGGQMRLPRLPTPRRPIGRFRPSRLQRFEHLIHACCQTEKTEQRGSQGLIPTQVRVEFHAHQHSQTNRDAELNAHAGKPQNRGSAFFGLLTNSLFGRVRILGQADQSLVPANLGLADSLDWSVMLVLTSAPLSVFTAPGLPIMGASFFSRAPMWNVPTGCAPASTLN